MKNKILSILLIGIFPFSSLLPNQVCKEDQEKFCKDVKPGEGRIFECLAKNFDQLSDKCKAKIETKKAKWDLFKENCGSDLEKLCPNTPIGKGKIHSCLAKNKDQLSEKCKNYLVEKKENKKQKKEEFKKLKELEKTLKEEK